MASNAENVSIWWRHHAIMVYIMVNDKFSSRRCYAISRQKTDHKVRQSTFKVCVDTDDLMRLFWTGGVRVIKTGTQMLVNGLLDFKSPNNDTLPFPVTSQIAKFMGPTWGPPGSCRPQMGPMLTPRTLLSVTCFSDGRAGLRTSSHGRMGKTHLS